MQENSSMRPGPSVQRMDLEVPNSISSRRRLHPPRSNPATQSITIPDLSEGQTDHSPSTRNNNIFQEPILFPKGRENIQATPPFQSHPMYIPPPPVPNFLASSPPASPPSSPERTGNVLPMQLPSFNFLDAINNPTLRKQYISAMLEACTPSELAFVSQTVANSLKCDFLMQLPVELAYHIISFVDHPESLTRISQVSRSWYRLSRDESIWKHMCILHGFNDWDEAEQDMQWDLERKRRKLERLGKGKGKAKERSTSDEERAKTILARHGNAKLSYRRHFKTSWIIRTNWRVGGELLDIHKMPIVSPDSGTVTSLALDGEYVVAGFSNAMIKVYSAVSGVLCKTLVGHESGVWSVCLISKGGTRHDGESTPMNDIASPNPTRPKKQKVNTNPTPIVLEDELLRENSSRETRRQSGSKVTVKLGSERKKVNKKIPNSSSSNLPAEFLRLNLQAPTDDSLPSVTSDSNKGREPRGLSSVVSPSEKSKRKEPKQPPTSPAPASSSKRESRQPSSDQQSLPNSTGNNNKTREGEHPTSRRHRRMSEAKRTINHDVLAPTMSPSEREPVQAPVDSALLPTSTSDGSQLKEDRHSTSHRHRRRSEANRAADTANERGSVQIPVDSSSTPAFISYGGSKIREDRHSAGHRHRRKSDARHAADGDVADHTPVTATSERESNSVLDPLSSVPAGSSSGTTKREGRDDDSHRHRRRSEANHDAPDQAPSHRHRTSDRASRHDGLHVMPDETVHGAIPLSMQLALGLDTGFDLSTSETESSQMSDDAEQGQEQPAPYQYVSTDEEDAEDFASLEWDSPFNMTYSTQGWGQPNHIIVSGGCDKTVRVWDAATGQCIYVLHGHRSTIRCMRVLKNRPIAITGSRDNDLRVWDVQKGICLRILSGHLHNVRCMDVSGNKLVSGSYDSTCRLWNIDTGECLRVLQGHFHQIYSVAFDGVRIASGGLDTTVRVWDAETGKCIALLQGHTALVCEVHLSPTMLVTGGSDGRVITFSLDNYQTLHRIVAHDSSVTALQFDNDHLVTGGNDGRVKLYETQTGKFVRELSDPSESVWKVAFVRGLYAVMCKRGGKTVVEIWSLRPKSKKSVRKERRLNNA